MYLTFTGNEFEVKCRFEDKDLVKRCGKWTWDGEQKVWRTQWEGVACFLYMFADETCRERLEKVFANVPDSVKEARALSQEEIERVKTAMVSSTKKNTLSDKQVKAIHKSLKSLAGMCDGAWARDYAGFNAHDAGLGHDLALRETLTYKQAFLGFQILRKYHRQIPVEVYTEIYGKPYEKKKTEKEGKKHEQV